MTNVRTEEEDDIGCVNDVLSYLVNVMFFGSIFVAFLFKGCVRILDIKTLKLRHFEHFICGQQVTANICAVLLCLRACSAPRLLSK